MIEGRTRSALRRRAGAVVLVLSALALVAQLPAASAADPTGAVTAYTGTDISGPVGIASGADGALWFTNWFNDSIGRITTSGAVSNYTGTGISSPAGIAAGPDGNLWFTNFGNSSIGRITPLGTVTNFTGAGIDSPAYIAAGPDGNLWFTNGPNSSIGRITTAGLVTSFTDPIIANPTAITAGPDGNLWFSNHSTSPPGGSIGRITPSGTVSEYSGGGISNPGGITAGPDGNLWFTNGTGTFDGSIGRITTSGVVTMFTDPKIRGASAIAAGPDGNLWFTKNIEFTSNRSLGRITTSGAVTLYTEVAISYPSAIVAGPDGNMWFTNLNNSIGRIGTAPAGFRVVTGALANASLGNAYSWTVVAADGVAPYQWTKKGGLPKGLLLNRDTGVISGTPTRAEVATVTITVKDSSKPKQVTTKAFSLTVTAPTLAITTAALPDPTLGNAYTASLAATGGTAPYRWKKSGPLPKGLRLDAGTGVISGTPEKAGSFTFTVTVKDKSKPKRTASRSYTLVV